MNRDALYRPRWCVTLSLDVWPVRDWRLVPAVYWGDAVGYFQARWLFVRVDVFKG